MILVIFIVAVGLVGLLFYRRPLKIDRSDLMRRPDPPEGPGQA